MITLEQLKKEIEIQKCIDNDIVWGVIESDLPGLIDSIKRHMD